MARLGATSPGPVSIGLYIFLWVLVLLSAVMFGICELRAVQNRMDILPLRERATPVSCETSPENEGHVVHIDCPLHKLYTFHPPAEFAWNLRPFRGVFLEMKVEMFQWVLKSRLLGFYFRGEWSPNLVDSSAYPFLFYNSHINPGFMPTINGAGRRFAPQIYGGGFRLSRKHLLDFTEKKQLPLSDDGYYTPPVEHPPTTVSYLTTQVHQDALYTGNPRNPKIGDLRITFWGSTATHVSAIAQQRRNPRDGVIELTGISNDIGRNRTLTELVYEGDYTPDQIFRAYLRKHDGSPWMIWGFRVACGILLTTVIVFSYQMFSTSTKVAILPLVAGSAALATGIIMVVVSPFWLLCDIPKSIVLAVIGTLLLPVGRLLWAYGALYTRQLEEDSALELLPRETMPPSGKVSPLPITSSPTPCDGGGGDSSQQPQHHFYQPV